MEIPDTSDVYKAMFKALEEPGFLPVIQAASKLIGAPVVFTDERYHLIAQHPMTPIGDMVYDTLLEQGSLPIEVIADYQQAYLMGEGKYYEPFYAEGGPAASWPRIFAEVHNEERILGHLGVFVGRVGAQPWQLAATAILANTLRIKMRMVTQPFMSLSNSFAILLDEASSEELKARAILNLRENQHHPGLLVAAPLNLTTGQQAFAAVAISHIQRTTKNVVLTPFQNDLVMLITSRNPRPLLDPLRETAENIARFLAKHQISCGAVGPVEDLQDLSGYFWQAHLTAVVAGEQDARGGLSHFEDLAPAQVYRFLIDSGKSRLCAHPLLPRLRKYDRENATQLYATLSAYSKTMFDKNATSDALHIHRNTLLYRLNRIEALFGVDLADARTLHRLLLSYGVEEMGAEAE